MSTLQEINSYLLKECPDEYPKLPATDRFTFINTPCQLADGDVGDKRPEHLCNFQLRLGVSDGEYTSGRPVYLCLGGAGYNEIFLSCEARLYKLAVENLSHVRLEQAYRNLLLCEMDTRAAEEVEKSRLKAWACYMFLRAGHIPTLQPYVRLLDELRYACTWMAREYGVKVKTARQKAAVQRKKEEAAESRLAEQDRSNSSANSYSQEDPTDIQSPATTSGTRDQSTNAAEQPGPSAVKRENDDNETDNMSSRPPKRQHLDQSLAKLLDRHGALGHDLQAFEREYASFGNDTELVGQLKHDNSQHVAKITKLERQLLLQVKEIEKLRTASREMEESVRLGVQNTEREKAARDAEAELRKKAEDRFTEYLDAQKRMTARFG
ncbi:hypothetical protein HBH56_198050 [Parastagonospora nodorum]|uniref:Uncharacterized protein n=1 Tax=Phaeosphaeria nodorum (strain SN15 / ATCC MYA-4574 / FGSC 10173) TaxID=321614 RepID=A0A7U2F3C8_PHANO|nr:hypothetical protein HBH56_198050 [Parastagonospora nodorum]QRC97657.1 hypothetical protein JI435_085700 [Parastagonospora nodorum SN15]KAH3924609.1 hypothetical protein HBH54_191010 [Parastagonospora nodorum]KAH3965989.1 hypothetical protein HBH52_201480 [Parastagonospora nodorum]KAH4130677.1 hypothetical protein HBH45_195190 [Parastagonospora nodorum]